MDYTIGLTSTAAGFGGRRWWFVCPISGRRCAVLYLPRGAHRFGSAKSYGLAYGVTRLAEHDRLWHRMAKIARRLGDDDPRPGDPAAQAEMDAATRPMGGCSMLGTRRPSAGTRIYDAKIARFVARRRAVRRMISENRRDLCQSAAQAGTGRES